ncbi:MAG TPA: TIGR03936 family radical SAM-associated protein, partial [Clostridia bacterium]|nr:TIGR03936 family radical SAM-associated protein [Clostridia bacterium]
MMYIRLKFTKGSEVKYISHLDLMRVFQRALRRTGIPISYSSGFNPHMEISFG